MGQGFVPQIDRKSVDSDHLQRFPNASSRFGNRFEPNCSSNTNDNNQLKHHRRGNLCQIMGGQKTDIDLRTSRSTEHERAIGIFREIDRKDQTRVLNNSLIDKSSIFDEIHRKSQECQDMHSELVRKLSEVVRDSASDQQRTKTIGDNDASLFTQSPRTSLGKVGRRREHMRREEEEEEEEHDANGVVHNEYDDDLGVSEAMARTLKESKEQRSMAELALRESEDDIILERKREHDYDDDDEQERDKMIMQERTTMSRLGLGSSNSTVTTSTKNNNGTNNTMAKNQPIVNNNNKKKAVATDKDYLIDMENLKKERNALKKELGELGEDVEYHRMASAASRIECDNNEDEKQRLEIELQDLEIEVREVSNRLDALREETSRAEEEASGKISFLKELDHEQEEAEQELETLKECCLEEERKLEERIAEREVVEEALHSLRGELEEEKAWKAQFLDEVREAERQAEDATTAMKNANEKTRIERKNLQLLEQKKKSLEEQCEKLLSMQSDIENFIRSEQAERMMQQMSNNSSRGAMNIDDNDLNHDYDDDDDDAPNGSSSSFSTPGKEEDSDYTQYSPDSPLPPPHQNMFTFKEKTAEAFTPGGSVKTSPRVSELIAKAAQSPLRANVGKSGVVEELSPWLMTFDDTPPEKKQNLIDLKTPKNVVVVKDSSSESYESIRLQADFIKMQQRKEREKTTTTTRKTREDKTGDFDFSLASLQEKLETQERRLLLLEKSSVVVPRPTATTSSSSSQIEASRTTQTQTTTNSANNSHSSNNSSADVLKKSEARQRLLIALRSR